MEKLEPIKYTISDTKTARGILRIKKADGTMATEEELDKVLFSSNQRLDLKRGEWVTRNIKGTIFLLYLQ